MSFVNAAEHLDLAEERTHSTELAAWYGPACAKLKMGRQQRKQLGIFHIRKHFGSMNRKLTKVEVVVSFYNTHFKKIKGLYRS